jgi:hypothetical protein
LADRRACCAKCGSPGWPGSPSHIHYGSKKFTIFDVFSRSWYLETVSAKYIEGCSFFTSLALEMSVDMR